MEDAQVFPNTNSPHDPHSGMSDKLKKIILTVVGLIILCLIIVGAYYLGKGSDGLSNNISPTPELSFPTIAISPTSEITPTSASGTVTLSPTPSPTTKTKILNSQSNLDGFRTSNNEGNETLEIRAGRNESSVTRGFVSFDLTELQQGIVVTEATLRIYQAKIVGNPYSVGDQLKADHLNYGDGLDSDDYGLAALTSSFATLSQNKTIQWKDLIVTEYLKSDIANARPRSQYRVHFQTETTGGNSEGDLVYFESADNNMATGNTPQLVIKYQ